MNSPAILARFADLQCQMQSACVEAGRKLEDVTLIAVSKTYADQDILPLLEAGHRVFGENRVQEASAKWPMLKQRFGNIELHLVGALQSNKAREAVALFDVIHSLDRESLAEALRREIAQSGKAVRLFVQVNTGAEAQKGGVLPQEADDFIALCRSRYNLPIVGLMCIPPVDEAPAPHFALTAKIAKRNGLGELSMGMSGDFETAIAFGATYIRVGSAIFGERN